MENSGEFKYLVNNWKWFQWISDDGVGKWRAWTGRLEWRCLQLNHSSVGLWSEITVNTSHFSGMFYKSMIWKILENSTISSIIGNDFNESVMMAFQTTSISHRAGSRSDRWLVWSQITRWRIDHFENVLQEHDRKNCEPFRKRFRFH